MSALSILVGSRIKRLRERRKLTQVQLCKITGIHQSDLSFIETGNRLPTLGTICTICRATKMPLAMFFMGFPTDLA